MAATKRKTAVRKKQTAKKAVGKSTSSGRTATARKKTSKKSTSSGRKVTVPVPEPKTPVYNFPLFREILVIIALGFCVLLFISCFQKPGSSFSWMQDAVFYLFGQASYVIPVFAFITVCYIIVSGRKRGVWLRVLAMVLFGISICGTASLIAADGGIIGNTMMEVLLLPALGKMGAYIVMVVLALIGIVMFSGHSIVRIMRSNSQKAYRAVRSGQEIRRGEHQIRSRERELQREKEKSRRLIEQRRRLEELEAQKEREIARRGEIELIPVRGITDVTLEPDEEDRTTEKPAAEKKRRGKRNNEDIPEWEKNGQEDMVCRQAPEEFMGEIHFGDGYPDEEDSVRGKADSRTAGELEALDRGASVEEYASETVKKIPEEPWPSEEDIVRQATDAEATEDGENDSFWREPGKEIVPSGVGFSMEDRISGEDSISDAAAEDSVYRQELPPDPVQTPVTEMKNTYSNVSPREKEEKNLTKTVRTATGKVITVELDGLPGENKRPAEAAKRRSSEETETVIVPQEYVEPKEYIFPPLSYLKKGSMGSASSKEETAKRLKETAMKLQQTLHNFGVGVTVTDISCGPSVTRYELQPEQGVKVSRIVSLTDDIKLNLAAADIRMEAPIPGKAAIGIEVPNREKQSVMLRDMLESEEFKKHPSKVVFAAGKDIGGSIVLADIAKMPHLLIAGATGSGKSVCINTIIMSILYKAKPSEVKLIMIDPKVVELSVYNGIPHLLIPVVTDPKKAAGALNWAVTEMTDRYQKFAKYRVRDMKGYNEKVEAAVKNGASGQDVPKKMPQIVIIVDELADLMMVAPGDVEEAICRLAQMARAAGIHLVIATQRPSVNVITGLIKANVPSRIAFSVSSGVDSRTIIDMNGAEKLLGKGDMLFYPSGYPKPLRVQGCFVSDEEVQEVVKFLADQKNVIGGEQDSSISLEESEQGGAGGRSNDVDEYFEKAGRFIIEKDKASIGMLQRVFKIGFNRAARIMDQLASAGVVSEEEGTKPRRVLMTMEEFENRIR